ncbi:MAG: hypothetical protein AB9866_17075 [Syntrophobacteraceae bacterium]
MSSFSISSLLSGSDSVSQQLLEMKNSAISTLLGSVSTSSESSLTEIVCSANTEACTFSAISKSLGAISKVAVESGVSDVMENVKLFAVAMESDGVDTISILKYLRSARDLAESDPEKFREIFSTASTDTTDTTIDSLSVDS